MTRSRSYDDPLAIWWDRADEVREPVPVGHFIPQEAADGTTRQLLDFLTQSTDADTDLHLVGDELCLQGPYGQPEP
ncbi:hypothetical protein AB0B94_07680 [Micromonospora sp. NPDC048986]|uniref:hypothetical protein n=1 Tax=Micromonospora sp. NPDC048986 TaxID=3155644 RepID=UPI0033E16E34